MNELEFYASPDGSVMVYHVDTHTTEEYCMAHKEFTRRMWDLIETYYPDAAESLSRWFERSKLNKEFYLFLRVRQFILCNFSMMDNRVDIDTDNHMNFEFVSCPVRSTCQYCGVVCSPRVDSRMTPAEYRVMQLYYDNIHITDEEIAERTFLSPHTVANHRKHVLQRLGVNNLGQFQVQARKFNFFK